MTQHFDATSPIYLQLGDRIKRRIIRGELAPGARLPSVREMAVDAGLNPNTVQRTYADLEASGITVKQRGLGTFVTEDADVLRQLREHMKSRQIAEFVGQMETIGCGRSEIIAGVRSYIEERESGNDSI
ncbi:MAG: GntR family transcriptional regulator [Sporolactobacillus sp.]